MTKGTPVIIVAGQSNATNTVLLRTVYERAAATGALVVHLAVDGSPLDARLDRNGTGDWSAANTPGSGELYQQLLRQMDQVMDPASRFAVPGAFLQSMIWVQGEADAWGNRPAQDYGANLLQLHEALVDRYGDHTLVLSRLSDLTHTYRNFSPTHERNWRLIQAAQDRLANSRDDVVLVNPDEVGAAAGMQPNQIFNSDFIHYNTSTGFVAELGRTLAARAMPSTRNSAPMIGMVGDDRANSFTLGRGEFTQVYGGRGIDTLVVTDPGQAVQVMEMSPGSVWIGSLEGDPATRAWLESIEVLELQSGNDRVRLGGTIQTLRTGAGDDHVDGSDIGDFIDLGAGHDTVLAGDGADTIFGGDGNDLLDGGAGMDLMTGGNGDDVYYVDDLGDRVIEAAHGGNDTIYLNGPKAFSLPDFVENLIVLTRRGAEVNGNALDNLMTGSDGRDVLLGQCGNDTLDGGAGNDVLRGGAGNDVLIGGEGDDLLFGNIAPMAADTVRAHILPGFAQLLRGLSAAEANGARPNAPVQDTGADTFVFSGNAGRDKIFDFEPGNDQIRIAGMTSLADLTVVRVGHNLVLSYETDESSGTITLVGLGNHVVSADWFQL